MRSTLLASLLDAWRCLVLCLRPAPALAAEDLFLRKQLALYQQPHVKPRRATNATRMVLVWLGLRVSPRTVRQYMLRHCVGGPGKRGPSQSDPPEYEILADGIPLALLQTGIN
jgi:hypothetical protein